MAACAGIRADGSRCRAQAITKSEWCFNHHPNYEGARRKRASKGGKRGGRGRPVVELRAIEDKLEDLANNVLGGSVEPGLAAVLVQIRNAQIRAISMGLKAKEQEELEARISELEQQQEGGRQWGT